jgi:hypothetical protein
MSENESATAAEGTGDPGRHDERGDAVDRVDPRFHAAVAGRVELP